MRRLLIAAAYLFGLVLCTGYAEAAIVPCDIGPPAQIPPEAQIARLTHCVANFAFNDPEYWIPGWDLGRRPLSIGWIARANTRTRCGTPARLGSSSTTRATSTAN